MNFAEDLNIFKKFTKLLPAAFFSNEKNETGTN